MGFGVTAVPVLMRRVWSDFCPHARVGFGLTADRSPHAQVGFGLTADCSPRAQMGFGLTADCSSHADAGFGVTALHMPYRCLWDVQRWVPLERC